MGERVCEGDEGGERELEAGGLGILRTGRRDIHPFVQPSLGASVWGWKGARETAEGSDGYNRDAHTFNKRCDWNSEVHGMGRRRAGRGISTLLRY